MEHFTTMGRQALHVSATTPEPTKITAEIISPKKTYSVVTESTHDLDSSLTPWIPPTVAVGMRHRWNVHLDGPADSVAMEGSRRAQQVISSWDSRKYREISLSSEGFTDGAPGDGRGVGCFFSGGVDSFYSAITGSDRITHLIFVRGFDIRVGDDVLGPSALAAARTSAAELGKPLIEVTTTIRSRFGDRRRMLWGHLFHGPALAHVGLALSKHLHTVIIPSTYSGADLPAWGTHPQLDPLWSSSDVAVEHDAHDADRFAKVAHIASSDTAMNNLRVCWKNPKGAYNCGRCPKCIRTKFALLAAGADSSTLPDPIDPKVVRRLILTKSEQALIAGAERAITDAGIDDPELVEAMRVAQRRSRFWQKIVY